MSRSISTKLREWWNSRNIAKRTLSSSKTQELLDKGKLLGRKPIANTPFEVVGEEKQGYFLALGKFRLTEPMKTEQDIEDYLNSNMYNVMLTVIQLITPYVVKTELAEWKEKPQMEVTPDGVRTIN
ncbi:MAG: hypothetical protein [Microviridae sp.]|nr:MAG: hypothetical protein [Microviridae sp.]